VEERVLLRKMSGLRKGDKFGWRGAFKEKSRTGKTTVCMGTFKAISGNPP